MLRYPIDYFMVIVVGLVVGFVSMLSVGPMKPDPEIPTFRDLQEKIASGEIDTKPKPATRGSIDATYEWLGDTERFNGELEYLMEANCSDHAMREYGRLLSNLDMGGFDPETGRLIGVDGYLVTYWGMKTLINSVLPLQPLAYMKDEFVPENFRAVMKNVKRKTDWTTCKFNLNPVSRR